MTHVTRIKKGQEIVVPGSISNLGPAFDALSVAVTVYLRLTVVDVDPATPGVLDMAFESGGAPPGENRIAMAFRAAEARFGQTAPGLRVKVQSDIPMRAGLGSSAAATIAGIRLYELATGQRPLDDVMAIATTIEGHPDNAAAARLGGLALSCQYEDGRIAVQSWPWPAGVRFVVGTPEAELETAFARKVLPATVPMRDAVFNLQRALLLVRALDTGQYGQIREALKDRWHQPPRQPFVPGLAEALATQRPGILGVCLSGAGPSIAMLTDHRHVEAASALADIYQHLGLAYTIRTLSAHQPSTDSQD